MNTGRDHHPFAFSMFMAGGGIKGGQVYGKSDEIGWGIDENPVHVNDFHATLLRLFGLDHLQLSQKFGGFDLRLTNVGGEVVEELIAWCGVFTSHHVRSATCRRPPARTDSC